jgi:AAA domain
MSGLGPSGIQAKWKPIELSPRAVRKAMFDNGYVPIPLRGKAAFLQQWQNITVNEAVIDGWGDLYLNTGMRTSFTAVFDSDILDEVAAHLVDRIIVRELYHRGVLIARRGMAPKCAYIFQTRAPFKKVIRKFKSPDGAAHKIEILCDGQQLAVAGAHPDTGEPFLWKDGFSVVNIPRAHLPIVDAAMMQSLVDMCARELTEKLGWVDAIGPEAPAASNDAPTDFKSLAERLAATEWQGEHGLNDAILHMTAMHLNNGTPVEEAIDECMTFVRGVWEKIPDEDPCKHIWDWNTQRQQIEAACYGFIQKHCHDEPRLSDTMPARLLKVWREIEQRGGTPKLQKRRFWGVEDGGPAEVIPDVTPGNAADVTVDSVPTVERKIQFRLVKFQDMRPGLEPAYLVDELMPSAGLVLLWGKQKTFKSFWLLDLMVHIALGWSYRDHAVRQGTVIYCAFEGGHGYKGRIEAIRRHYKIADDVSVPLYVMPGQVDLIRDEKALIRDFREQLGETVPAVVVLDTLNRSLSGSESSDKDMTMYVKAAEEIRKAFGCVCVIVHHCGYDDTHARGHTSLPAAVDAELSVERAISSPLLVVTVRQMRDGPEGMIVRSRAQSVPLDPDSNGKPRTSIVVVPDDTPGDVVLNKQGRPDTTTPVLYEALQTAIDTKGEYHTPEGKVPLQAADEAIVRDIFYRRFIDGEEDALKSLDARRKAFKRALHTAVERGVVNGEKVGTRQLLWFKRNEGVLE